MDDVDVLAVPGPAQAVEGTLDRRAHNVLRPDEVDADIVMTARQNGPANLWFGGPVGTHSVYDYVDWHLGFSLPRHQRK